MVGCHHPMHETLGPSHYLIARDGGRPDSPTRRRPLCVCFCGWWLVAALNDWSDPVWVTQVLCGESTWRLTIGSWWTCSRNQENPYVYFSACARFQAKNIKAPDLDYAYRAYNARIPHELCLHRLSPPVPNSHLKGIAGLISANKQ